VKGAVGAQVTSAPKIEAHEAFDTPPVRTILLENVGVANMRSASLDKGRMWRLVLYTR